MKSRVHPRYKTIWSDRLAIRTVGMCEHSALLHEYPQRVFMQQRLGLAALLVKPA